MKQSPKAESWIREKRRIESKKVRLTIDVTPEMHQRLKMKCVMEHTTIADMVRGWMEEKLKKHGKHGLKTVS
jgi:hypothetical protein